ncbi:MAG: AbrB family transcriptional regulator [Lautropia sp.]|nr:AbrB family transcriptional regulator [Lautropia sp.]
MNWKELPVLPVAGGLCIALVGVASSRWLGIPLPWLLGPLLLTAATRIAGVPTQCPPAVNKFGRWVIGLSLGLYFTPEVAGQVMAHWALILFGIVYALLLAWLGSAVYQRKAGLDPATAWFAAAIGSASEMANMAKRNGARIDQVVSAHSLRVLIVVTIVPFAFQWHAGDMVPVERSAGVIDWFGLALLVAGSLVAVWFFERLRIPNSWILGAMTFSMCLTLNDISLTAMPPWLSWAGQLAIGWSLGDKYRSDFFRTAPRLLGWVTVLTLSFICLSALLGWAIASAASLPAATMILALTPGGIAEMTITAKALGLGVPLVTAMQVMRMLAVVLSTEFVYRRWMKSR